MYTSQKPIHVACTQIALLLLVQNTSELSDVGENTIHFGKDVVSFFPATYCRVVLTFIVLFLTISFVFIHFIIYPHLCIQKMFFRTIVQLAQECYTGDCFSNISFDK